MKEAPLWPRVLEITRRGLTSGALQPLTTVTYLIEEAGVRFLVRQLVPATGNPSQLLKSSACMAMLSALAGKASAGRFTRKPVAVVASSTR